MCPPEVLRAHHIDDLINERAGTCELNDSDFDDDVERAEKVDDSDDNKDDTNLPPEPSHTAVARSARMDAPPTRRNARGAAATELMNRFLNAFDPEVQRARDDERANRAFATTQYLTLSQQLRDAQAMNDKLRDQIYDLRNDLYEAQRSCDRAEMRLEMLRMSHSGGSRRPTKLRQPKRKRQSYEWFADGGESIAWIPTDEEDLDDFYKQGYKSQTGKHAIHCLMS